MKPSFATSVRDGLERIIRLYRDPYTWIKGDWAKTARRGTSVTTMDPSAVCFCLDGAIEKVCAGTPFLGPVGNAIRDAISRTPEFRERAVDQSSRMASASIIRFNDHRKTTVREIRAVLRSALQAAA